MHWQADSLPLCHLERPFTEQQQANTYSSQVNMEIHKICDFKNFMSSKGLKSYKVYSLTTRELKEKLTVER